MPYVWLEPENTAPGHPGAVPHSDRPHSELHLWPYRSLPRRGFVWFIGITAAMIGLPLIALVGSPALWGMLPFVAAAVGGIWWAIERSYRDGAVLERLCLWPDKVTLTRQEPRRSPRLWEANPHWVRVAIYADNGPVEQYLTLTGAGREVEIGAFLSAAERQALYGELARRFA